MFFSWFLSAELSISPQLPQRFVPFLVSVRESLRGPLKRAHVRTRAHTRAAPHTLCCKLTVSLSSVAVLLVSHPAAHSPALRQRGGRRVSVSHFIENSTLGLPRGLSLSQCAADMSVSIVLLETSQRSLWHKCGVYTKEGHRASLHSTLIMLHFQTRLSKMKMVS